MSDPAAALNGIMAAVAPHIAEARARLQVDGRALVIVTTAPRLSYRVVLEGENDQAVAGPSAPGGDALGHATAAVMQLATEADPATVAALSGIDGGRFVLFVDETMGRVAVRFETHAGSTKLGELTADEAPQ